MLSTTAANAGTVQATGSAAQASPSPWYILKNLATGRCLDDSGASQSADLLRGYPCNSSSWQAWRTIQIDSNSFEQLQNQATGRCLDWSPQYGLRGFTCYPESFDGGWQAWYYVNRPLPGGNWEDVFLNGYQANGNYCLDDSGSTPSTDLLRGYPCNGASQDAGYQGWT